MTQTRVRVKGRGKVPDLDGYATPQRLQHASHGMTMPVDANGEGYINTALLSECAPNHVAPSPLQRALKVYEIQKLKEYCEAATVYHGRPRSSRYDGTPAPTGKMSGGRLHASKSDAQLITWYRELHGFDKRFEKIALPLYAYHGLHYLYRIETGQGDGHTLERIGRAMSRMDSKDAIIGGYVSYYAAMVQEIYATETRIKHKKLELNNIEAAEKKAAQLRRIKRITGG